MLRRIAASTLFIVYFFMVGVSTADAQAQDIAPVPCQQGAYFPPGSFAYEIRDADYSRVIQYEQYLKAAEEPPLCSSSDPNVESYRFLWLRQSWAPLILRVERRVETIQLFLKVLDSAGRPGPLEIVAERSIKPEEWAVFVDLLNESAFWKAPTQIPLTRPDFGSSWILEGNKNSSYHVVIRQGPSIESRLPEAAPGPEASCLYLLILSRFNPSRIF